MQFNFEKIKNFIVGLLDYVYKKRCYFCRSSKESLPMCSKCYDEMEFLNFGTLIAFDGVPVYCAGYYNKNLQKLIRAVKYHNRKDLAYYQAKFMYEYWQNVKCPRNFRDKAEGMSESLEWRFRQHSAEGELPEWQFEREVSGLTRGMSCFAVTPAYAKRGKQVAKNCFYPEGDFTVIPVPLHKNRQKKRGYNHMELVGEEFCRLTGYTLNTDFITRVKDTKPQYKLNPKERAENLAGAFEIDKNSLIRGKILLIDDICTTGSTFSEIIKTLKSHGINDITCFATTAVKF